MYNYDDLEKIGVMSIDDLEKYKIPKTTDELKEEKKQRYWNLLHEYVKKTKKSPNKPNWDLKEDIYLHCCVMIDLTKILNHDKCILYYILTSKNYYLDIEEDKNIYNIVFEYENSQNKTLKGHYWVSLYITLLKDFESVFNVKFTKQNIERYINITSSYNSNELYKFIKLFSSDFTNLEALTDVLIDKGVMSTLPTRDILITECEKLCNSLLKKRNRVAKKVNSMIEHTCYFCTFTFNDKCLNTTNENTRRQIVRRIFTSLHCHYIGNIDYGKKTEREHYHVLVQIDDIDINYLNKIYSKYGFFNVKKVRSSSDKEKITNYIHKLTNHALKKTKCRTRLLYDRL